MSRIVSANNHLLLTRPEALECIGTALGFALTTEVGRLNLFVRRDASSPELIAAALNRAYDAIEKTAR